MTKGKWQVTKHFLYFVIFSPLTKFIKSWRKSVFFWKIGKGLIGGSGREWITEMHCV